MYKGTGHQQSHTRNLEHTPTSAKLKLGRLKNNFHNAFSHFYNLVMDQNGQVQTKCSTFNDWKRYFSYVLGTETRRAWARPCLHWLELQYLMLGSAAWGSPCHQKTQPLTSCKASDCVHGKRKAIQSNSCTAAWSSPVWAAAALGPEFPCPTACTGTAQGLTLGSCFQHSSVLLK